MVKRLLISIFIISFAILLAGCSVGIRPAYYDLPPIDENQNYYGEPAYNSYPSSSSTEYKYDYDSTYDPWTMGTYYNYTPPVRVSRTAESSSTDNSASTTDRRPSVQSRNTSSDSNSMSPRRENSAIGNESTQKTNTEANSDPRASSSSYKKKRELNSEISQSNDKSANSEQPSDSKKEDEEENKDKKRKKSGNN